MSKSALLCVLLCSAIGIGRSSAQQDDAAPPSPPFVQELPQNASWKVTITQKNKPAAPGPTKSSPVPSAGPHDAGTIKEEKITRMDGNMHVVRTWSDGTTTDEWRYEGFILYTQPYTSEIYVLGRSQLMSKAFPTMSESAFPEFDWLKADNFARVENAKQKSVYLFQEEAVEMPSSAVGKNLETMLAKVHPAIRAWIDRTTKLPVAFDDGTSVRVYEYFEPPTTPLVLPPVFTAALEKLKHDIVGLHQEKMKL